jgi:hypothetical protein
MRKPLLLSIAIGLSVFSSCSKKNADSDSTVWTFNGNTYKTTNSGYDSAGAPGILEALDAAGNGISIEFNSHPKVNGTYTVTQGFLGPAYPANSCTLSAFNSSSTNYLSTGKQGDIVNVTVSNGKLQATFSNISIENVVDTTTVSGTIIELRYY